MTQSDFVWQPQRTESIRKYTLDRGSVIADYDKDENRTTRYIRGYDLISQEDGEGTINYYLHNAHGDIAKLVDSTGNVKNSYSYDAFGNTIDYTEKVENRFRYAGEQFDAVTGLIYLRARYYEPEVGRFTQEDAYRGDGLNLYVYVSNNPVLYFDPSGYCKDNQGTVKTYMLGEWVAGFDESMLEFYKPTDEYRYTNLSEEEILLICTVYGEAAGQSEASWMAVTNVIMNRVGNREWKKYDTVTEVIEHTGFDAYKNPNTPYKDMQNYLKNRNDSNAKKENFIIIILDVYHGKTEDNTNGAVFYYSPDALKAAHERNPDKFTRETPSWVNDKTEEVKVKGCENDDFQFYKYK